MTRGLIRYYVVPAALQQGGAASQRGGYGRGKAILPIQNWVAAHYTGRTVGADTVYDLAAPRP